MHGDALREARKATGLTQEELAREIGVTTASVNRWENGRYRPQRFLQRALEAFFAKQRGDPEATAA